MIDYSQLETEKRNERSSELDNMSALEAVLLMNDADRAVSDAVRAAAPEIAETADMIAESFRAGGRLIYCGAGTSGRLGVLDASECPPTFGVPGGMVVGVIAGGDTALRTAVEGAEDDAGLGVNDMKALSLNASDTLVAISSSGSARYCIGAADYANSIGAKTACVVCTPEAELTKHCRVSITAVTGPEVLTGSTRLKAGTATKLVLNTLTTVGMTKIGKVYKNLMVDMVPSNAKLHDRAVRIVASAADCDRDTAERALAASGDHMKIAIVSLLTGLPAAEAADLLRKNSGIVRDCVGAAAGSET